MGLFILNILNKIFQNKNYSIYKVNTKNNPYPYVVHNTNKPYEESHTHVQNFGLCKIMIYCCLKGEAPKKSKSLLKNKRFVESLTRVATNKHYNKFSRLLDELNN